MKPWNQAVCFFCLCVRCVVMRWRLELRNVVMWAGSGLQSHWQSEKRLTMQCTLWKISNNEKYRLLQAFTILPWSCRERCNMQCSLLFHSSKKSLHSPSFLTHPHLIPLLESWKDLLCWVALMPVAFSFTVFHFLLYVIVYNGWWYFLNMVQSKCIMKCIFILKNTTISRHIRYVCW